MRIESADRAEANLHCSKPLAIAMTSFHLHQPIPHCWQSLRRVALLSTGGLLLLGCQGIPQRDQPDPNVTAGMESPAVAASLPEAIRTAVMADAAERTGLSADQLTIIQAEPQDWPDGCLGIAEPDTLCTQAIVPGWQVVVQGPEQEWVYRTDSNGGQVKLAENRPRTDTRTGDGQAVTGAPLALSQTCSNTAIGYTAHYPADWITNSGEVLNSCQVFDPSAITLPEQSSSFDEAIHLRVDSVPFARATEESISEMELSRRTTTIDGLTAVVSEHESTGRGLLPAGTRYYSYTIDLGDGEVMVASTYDVANQSYSRNQQVLDQMVGSLQFERQ